MVFKARRLNRIKRVSVCKEGRIPRMRPGVLQHIEEREMQRNQQRKLEVDHEVRGELRWSAAQERSRSSTSVKCCLGLVR